MVSLLCFLLRRTEKKSNMIQWLYKEYYYVQYLKRIINRSKQFLSFYCLPGPVLDMGDVKMHNILQPTCKYSCRWDSSNIIDISRKSHIRPGSTTSSCTTYGAVLSMGKLWKPQFPHLYNGVLTSSHSEQCLEHSMCYKSLSSRDDLVLA